MKAMRMILAVAAVAIFASAANASLFWFDDFGYAAGGLTTYDGSNTGTGDNVSGGLWTTHSGATFPGGVNVTSGGRILLRQGDPSSEDVNRLTGATLAAGETLYASFQFTVADLRGGVESFDDNNDQSYFVHFGSSFRSRVHLRDAIGGTGFTLGLAQSSGNPSSIWGTDLTFGTQYLGIISYEFNTGLVKLWVNPSDESSDSISDTGTASVGLTNLSFRQDFINAGNGGDHAVVAINSAAIGTTFADVIPEPTTIALLGMGGLVLLRRRR